MKKKLFEGIFTANQRGFGFIKCEDLPDDVFVSPGNVNSAFSGDTVLFELISPASGGKNAEGRIEEIKERAFMTIVGTFERSDSYGFVMPDNRKFMKDVYISAENAMNAVTGSKVVVTLLDYGDSGHLPEGRITEVIGHVGDPGVDILSIIKAYEIPIEFPSAVRKETVNIPVSVAEEEIKGRKDFRDVLTVTIDGEDAKDLDDAISLEKTAEGWILGVHIADVSHYVKEGSALDKEALKRGTSVYLTDRVIPMLPHELSNGICSLNEGVDRLAQSCIMTVNENGEITDHEICESVIRSDHRLSYTIVHSILTDEASPYLEQYADCVSMLRNMLELSTILRGRRRQRGGIDFEIPESNITVDSDGNVLSVAPYERNESHKLIEDFMLAANETIAEDFYWQELPFVYRTHEVPDQERIIALTAMIRGFGYFLKAGQGEVHPMELQKLLTKIEGSPEENMISRLVLRSMKQARYTTVNFGHFALAVKYYCHFTSPIRRYPDLQIHRIIEEWLHGDLTEERIAHYKHILDNVANISSETERRSVECEREVDKMKKCQFMKDHIGEEFDGIVSGVANFGFFVELENTCEGLVSLRYMDEFYEYDAQNMMLVSKDSGRSFTLGQKVRVRVEAADMMTYNVDLMLADMEKADNEEGTEAYSQQ